MKIAFTTSGDSLDAQLDSRFGRAPKFLVYDLDTDSFEIVDNKQNLNAAQGAGIQSAESVSRTGAAAVVTGNCGPKAFRALQAAGVKIYTVEDTTIADALAQYREGVLKEAADANVEGHWI